MENQIVSVILDEIVSLKNQIDGMNMLMDLKKQKVKQYLDENAVDKIKNDDVTAYVSTRTKVTYNIKAIKEKLKKELWRSFIKRDYRIDPKMFKDICDQNKIDFNIFKEAFNIEESVDEEQLNTLYDSGEITVDDLKGTYDAQVTKTVSYRFRSDKDQEPVINVK